MKHAPPCRPYILDIIFNNPFAHEDSRKTHFDHECPRCKERRDEDGEPRTGEEGGYVARLAIQSPHANEEEEVVRIHRKNDEGRLEVYQCVTVADGCDCKDFSAKLVQ